MVLRFMHGNFVFVKYVINDDNSTPSWIRRAGSIPGVPISKLELLMIRDKTETNRDNEDLNLNAFGLVVDSSSSIRWLKPRGR